MVEYSTDYLSINVLLVAVYRIFFYPYKEHAYFNAVVGLREQTLRDSERQNHWPGPGAGRAENPTALSTASLSTLFPEAADHPREGAYIPSSVLKLLPSSGPPRDTAASSHAHSHSH